MIRHASRLAATLTFILVLPSTVLALEPTWKSVEAKSTAVSGFSGQLQVVEFPKGDNQGIDAISSHERSNRPCDFRISARNLDGNSTVPEGVLDADRCTPTSSRIDVGFGANPRYFVRGIAVCSSKVQANSKRMKGFRIVAAKIWQTKRELDDLATTDTDSRNNCGGNWHDTVYCDPGHVASGVNVYWDRKEDSIVGLGLRCRYVAWLGSK